MISAAELVHLWEEFFFAPAPVQPIALVRIALGLVLLYEARYLILHAAEYLGPNGLSDYGRYYKRNRGNAFSLFLYLPPTMRSVHLILGAHVVALSCMTLGLLTPVSTLASFITLRSIVNRNHEICNGGDNVAKVMCFLLVFAPAGRAYSLDELLYYAPRMPGGEYLWHAPWAQRLMQIQLSVIYLYTTYWKLKGATYRDGTAIYYAVTNDEYRRWTLPAVLLRPPLVQVMTWGTLAFEGAIGLGLWIKECQNPFVIAGIAFHLAIEYMFSVHLFGWYMMASLLVFLDLTQFPFR